MYQYYPYTFPLHVFSTCMYFALAYNWNFIVISVLKKINVFFFCTFYLFNIFHFGYLSMVCPKEVGWGWAINWNLSSINSTGVGILGKRFFLCLSSSVSKYCERLLSLALQELSSPEVKIWVLQGSQGCAIKRPKFQTSLGMPPPTPSWDKQYIDIIRCIKPRSKVA